MADKPYLDKIGLSEFWTAIKDYVSSHGGGGSVTGVKGDSESTYRTGDVNITKANIGLGNVDNKSSSTIKSELLDIFYPVGSYYETSDSNFDPNTDWGGTWLLETEGQFHISAGSTAMYNLGQTGGSPDAIIPSHSHTASGGEVQDKAAFNTNNHEATTTGDAGRHNHGFTRAAVKITTGSSSIYSAQSSGTTSTYTTDYEAAHNHTIPKHAHSIPAHGHGFIQPTISTEGVSPTNMNLPPFIAVNRWHRTA